MKSEEIIDTIIRYIEQRGIVTDESLLRRGQLYSLFGINAAAVISDRIRKAKEDISGKNYITSSVQKDTYNQGGKFNYFTLSPAVNNCYEYVGGTDGCTRFRECLTLSEFQNTVNCQVPYIPLYLTENGKLTINNTSIQEIKVQYIPVNPLLDPTFNYDYDEYPIDEILINEVLDRMFATYQSKTSQVPLDVKSDSKETNKSNS